MAGIRIAGLSVYQTDTRPDVKENLELWAKNRRADCEPADELRMAEDSDDGHDGDLNGNQRRTHHRQPHSPDVEGNEINSGSTPLSFPYACVLFSPSGVKAVFAALESLQWPVDDILFVAVGPSTLKALHAKGFRRTGMAEKPNPECVVDAIVRGF